MFESVARPQLIKRRLGAGTVVSVVMHAGILTAAMLLTRYAPAKNVTEIAVALVRPVHTTPPPPPPPPAARQAVRPKTKPVKQRPVIPQAIVAPKVVPEEKPPENLPEEPLPEEDEGVEGGVVGGVAGGVVGGVQGGIVGQPPPPANARMEFNDTMTPPAILSGPTIQYTEKALEREVQGLMVVKCVVTLEGIVRECRVIQSLPFMDRAVIEALEHRRYKPALLQGRPIEVDYTFKIRLNLPQ
jgi:protein TonB